MEIEQKIWYTEHPLSGFIITDGEEHWHTHTHEAYSDRSFWHPRLWLSFYIYRLLYGTVYWMSNKLWNAEFRCNGQKIFQMYYMFWNVTDENNIKSF